jgi:cobaltochelatase CobN
VEDDRLCTVALLSTSDTDLLAARSSGAGYRLANPARLLPTDLPAVLDGSDVVVVRLLGGEEAWRQGLARLRAQERPVIVVSGEQAPDAALMALSTVPAGIAAQAHEYLAHGGTANLRELARFLTDTVMLGGTGFAPPQPAPPWGTRDPQATAAGQPSAAVAGSGGRPPAPPAAGSGGRPPAPAAAGSGGRAPAPAGAPVIGIVYYRAHELAGNTAFVDALAGAVVAAGGRPLPVWCGSLRSAEPGLLQTLATADVLIVTVLAAGGSAAALAQAGGDDEAWDAGAIAALDVPVVQALCLTTPRADWADGNGGLSPLDAATQVAIPEFDGRLISVPFSFKETGDDGLSVYVADPERAARVVGQAVALARLRHTTRAQRRVAIVLSSYPTKHARIGNAVGLDTPASAVALLRALREAGYDIGPLDGQGALPGIEPPDGDALMHAIIAAGGQDPDWLTSQQLADAVVRIPAGQYRQWFAQLPPSLREAMQDAWGPPPGELYVDWSRDPDGELVLAALTAGNVVLLVQPPRGFGENPVAIYHDPDLPPSHHYLAAYRWLESGFGAHAVVHLGKHGTLEWLPGKSLGMSAECAPDAVLGDLPLIYPFLVNDPGEGTQAKRRAHATIISHLVPPMTRAETYGDLARLEQLLDEHASIAALDPAKLPAIRAQIWTLVQAARLDHDLGLESRPHDAEFDDFVLHVDGWLCEVKDAQIRDGLHVLGSAPTGPQRVGLLLAMLQSRQIWAGQAGALPGLRAALGLDESGAGRAETDKAEAIARGLVETMEGTRWRPETADDAVAAVLGRPADAVSRLLRFAATEIVPRLEQTTGEITAVLHALDGGHVPAGPSGSPLRGLVNVLPTGRNFYAVDPKAVPSRLAWETGVQLADSLLARYREETGQWPASVGLSVWGTAAMRTAGDDVAEVLALLGVRPCWDEASRRVTGLEVMSPAELGRPRIDVVIRISGFFRDAFPHVVTLLDDAVTLVAGLAEDPAENLVRAHVLADMERHDDLRRATSRVFGSAPGTYGAGLLAVMDSRSWRDDADLAEVYALWGGHAYGRGLDGRSARADMEAAYRRIAVAVKNTDTREHDIADSADYYTFHGGMVASVRALTGSAPRAYVGDSTRPDHVRTRTLTEESARVFRSRVVNPRWIDAMKRHGYKGAFELAATVDYLFGWDATTGVVTDWMYEQLAASYVFDPGTRKFLEESNPWALRGITERLLEAADRGLWAAPEADTIGRLKDTYLEVESQLEEAQSGEDRR